jgi:hypothetical protein
MSTFSWIDQAEELSPAALTVLAQTVSPNDNGRLLWDQFFPRKDVPSVDLRNLVSLDYRPAADRREWDQRGRRIPLKTPDSRNLEMVPIESNFRIDEREMQRLVERFAGTETLIRDQIKADVPARTEGLAAANYRRLELDAFQAWTSGKITVRDPETGETYDADFQLDTARMQTATTAWNDAGVNAYNLFIAWLRDAVDKVGPLAGVALRYPPLLAILADAPTLAGGAAMSLANLSDRVSQDTASPFQFFLVEDTVDVFSDGGIATTRTKKWPVSKIAAIPSDRRIGNAAFAPVARAVSLSRQVPEAQIDVNGVAVFPEADNGGRSLVVEAQSNVLPVPDESRVDVIDTGVTS